MKKAFILALCAMTLSALQAQQMYLKISAGAGIGTATTSMRTTVTYDDKGVATTKVAPGSLGSGGQFGFAAGYSLNDNIDFELGGQYLMGFGQKSSATSTGYTYEAKAYTRQWRVIPQVVFNIGDSDLRPYTRFGMLLPVGGKTVVEESSSSTSGNVTNTTAETTETHGTLSLGWTSGVGIRKNLGDRSFFFVDLGFQSLSIGAKKSEIVQYKYNGTDELKDLTTREKETEYVREYTPSTNVDNSKPAQTTRTWSPFSNLALSIGLQMNL